MAATARAGSAEVQYEPPLAWVIAHPDRTLATAPCAAAVGYTYPRYAD